MRQHEPNQPTSRDSSNSCQTRGLEDRARAGLGHQPPFPRPETLGWEQQMVTEPSTQLGIYPEASSEAEN